MNNREPGGQPVLPLRCTGLSKSFADVGTILHVLRGIDLEVGSGERLAITGESGAGKTTLLQLLGGLDTPGGGEVWIDGKNLATLNDTERGMVRNQSLGFVYQFHHLLPEFSALENVAMPLLLRRMDLAEVRDKATGLLRRVGLAERLDHKPGELSGGERQRVAVARALVTDPAVVLADEPTGNLDHKSGERVLKLMFDLNDELGVSLVLVTHSTEIAARMNRVLLLDNGVLADVTAEYRS